MPHSDNQLSKALQKLLSSEAPEADLIRRLLSDHPDISPESGEAIRALAQPAETSDGPLLFPEPRKTLYSTLLDSGLQETAASLLLTDPGLRLLKADDLPLISSSERTIARWLETQTSAPSATGDPTKELIARCLSEPAKALDSALATWTCRNIDPNSLRKLVPLVTEDTKQEPGRDLLAIVLLRDKEGDFITRWLKECDLMEATVNRILPSPRLLRHVMESAPKWFQHPNAEALPQLFMALMAGLPASTGKLRAELCGRLLTLAGSLVPIADRHPAALTLLQQLQTLGLETWKSAAESDDRHRTWAFIQAGNRTLSENNGPDLSPDQAKQLGLAVIRARRGKDALTELESLYVNLGGTRFGEVGETVPYDATIHNDLDGGILPDDPVTIVRTGLRSGDAGVVKADVRNLEQP